MFDAYDGDHAIVVIEPVDDAIRAPPRRPVAGQLSLQSLAESGRRIQQRAKHELNDRCGDSLREPSQRPLG